MGISILSDFHCLCLLSSTASTRRQPFPPWFYSSTVTLARLMVLSVQTAVLYTFMAVTFLCSRPLSSGRGATPRVSAAQLCSPTPYIQPLANLHKYTDIHTPFQFLYTLINKVHTFHKSTLCTGIFLPLHWWWLPGESQSWLVMGAISDFVLEIGLQ